ncbi:MAG TPA: protein kinase, partial [Polyangiaceae bacterium]
YVHGYHLGQWSRYVRLTRSNALWESCVAVMLEVLTALQYAHNYTRSDGSRAVIVHRDVSPGNILLDVDGNVRLADFGIASMDAEQTAGDRSKETVFKGKFPYAAPELFAGEKASPATDIYACAVVLYQLLTGSNPFSAQDASTIVRRVLTLIPPPVSKTRSDAPAGLDQLMSQMLDKNPSRRLATAKDFSAALRGLLTRSELDVATELSAILRADFTGDMPRVLAIQSLEERDLAWRKTSESLGALPIGSLPPTVRKPIVILQKEFGLPALDPLPTKTAPPKAPVTTNRSPAIAISVAALLVAGVATAAAWMKRAPTAGSEPHYLVVGSSGESEDSDSTNARSEVAPSSTGTPLASAAPSVSASKRSAAPAAESKRQDPGGSLSATFAKRQGAIQNCFQNNAVGVSGNPEVSVRFSIDSDGKVTSAMVRPDAIAATALGQCLAQVGRATSFGVQEKPLVFSIPITARVR